jgi:hypothetical protein
VQAKYGLGLYKGPCSNITIPYNKQIYMARIKGNQITEGMTGMINKQIVFKNRLGTRYAAAAPSTDRKRKPTAGQHINREKMKSCNEYAIEAMENAEVKKGYQAAAKGGQTAVNVAFSDAWHAHVVHDIIANGYKGNAGDTILVEATDNFKVSAVKVSIFDREGILVEEGQATPRSSMWMYVTQRDHDHAARIVATAFDLPGNKGVMEVLV